MDEKNIAESVLTFPEITSGNLHILLHLIRGNESQIDNFFFQNALSKCIGTYDIGNESRVSASKWLRYKALSFLILRGVYHVMGCSFLVSWTPEDIWALLVLSKRTLIVIYSSLINKRQIHPSSSSTRNSQKTPSQESCTGHDIGTIRMTDLGSRKTDRAKPSNNISPSHPKSSIVPCAQY